MMKPSVSGYSHLTEVVEQMKGNEGKALFITDGQVAANCEYVFRHWEQKPVCINFSEFSNPLLLLDFEKVYILKYDFHLPLYRKAYNNLIQVLKENARHLQPIHSIGNVHVFSVHSSLGQKAEDG